MNYLEGTQLKINTPTFKKNIGKRVKYILKGQNPLMPRVGRIHEVIRRQVELGGMDFIPFDRIVEIVLIEEKIDVVSILIETFPKDKYKTISSAIDNLYSWNGKDVQALAKKLGQDKNRKYLSVYIIEHFLFYYYGLTTFESILKNSLINRTKI